MLPAVTPKKEIGAAEDGEGFGRLPIGLRDHADPEPLRFKHATDHRHAETGMVYVAVARHDDDVATVPAELLHFFPRNGQPGCGAQAFRPELSIVIECGRLSLISLCLLSDVAGNIELRPAVMSNARHQDYVLALAQTGQFHGRSGGTIVAR